MFDVGTPERPWGSTTLHGNQQPPTRRTAPARKHLTYAPGLDGVRALAVTAVVVFHMQATALSGGFLGVDIFFVLSGFLITSILLAEFYSRRRISVQNFYIRRARRLLPALYTLLAVTTLVTWVFARDQLHRLRGDVVSAFFYCTNWTQIFWGQSYFDQLSRPSLLQHLWSLAVEEQYYLLWPLILIALLATRRRWLLLLVPTALAAGSLILMGQLFHYGEDPSRVYYGTDTHIAPILIGSILAIVLGLRREAVGDQDSHIGRTLADLFGRTAAERLGRVIADLFAASGLAVLVWAVVWVTFDDSWLYHGGYLPVSVAAAALIYAAGRPGTVTSRLLGAPPFVWVGKRSYSIYLWHWPILQLTRPGVDVHWPRPVLVVFQVGVTLLASDLSYRLIERPIRSKGFMAWLRGATGRGHHVSAAGSRRLATLGTAVAVVVALVAGSLVSAGPAPAGVQYDTSGKNFRFHLATPTGPKPKHHHRHHRGQQQPSAGTPTSSAPPQPPFPTPVRVSFFGDSQVNTLLINRPEGLGKYLSITSDYIEGCGYLLGVMTSRTGPPRDLTSDCGNWASIWRQDAAHDHAQVAVIETGAWDVFDLKVNGKDLKFGTPAWDAYHQKQLGQAIRILLHSGAQVALMGVPCYRPVAAGGLPLYAERGDDDRTRHLNALLRAAVAQNPTRVFMIHPPAAFCDNPSIATDLNYRWDGTHYYKPGADLVFRVITPQLLAIPQPPPH